MVDKARKWFRQFIIKIHENRYNITFFMVILLTLVGIVISIASFRIGVIDIHKSHLQENIKQMTEVNLVHINQVVNDLVYDLEVASKSVNKYEDFGNPNVIKILEYTKNISKYSFIGIADSDGKGYDNSGNIVNISNREYFQTAMNG